jgi:hypothetical protein
MAGAVEVCCERLLCQRKTHRVGQTLTERTGGGFHARRFVGFRMAGGLGVQLAETLELLDRQVETCQMQQRVLQHRAVAVGQARSDRD